MDKKEQVIVYCGSEPSGAMAKALQRASGEGYVIHTVSPSNCDPERLAGVQADIVIYNEAGTFDGMSEALDSMVDKGPKSVIIEGGVSRFAHMKNDPSKFDWKKFTKNVESTSRRR
jgi:hypothetical protein